MLKLDDMIILDIAKYFELIDLYHFKNTCKMFNNLLIHKFNLIHSKKINFIKKNYISVIWSLFGGVKKMALLPILKWKSYFEGSTGYIDQINPKNVTYPIMVGVDDYKRPYITIKTQSTFKKNIYSVVVTIFQRYSDSKSSWTHGTNGISFIKESGYIISGLKIIHKDIKDSLKTLINGEEYNDHILKYN